MKNLLILIAIIFAAFFVVNNLNLAPNELKKNSVKIGLPFELAKLSMQESDAKIALPVRKVRVNQIADTWHAPRSGERLHQGQDIFAPHGTAVYSATNGYVVRIGETAWVVKPFLFSEPAAEFIITRTSMITRRNFLSGIL
jgi:murein DD-endopeptidase MepM/ murein hydrolase activator NlpD